MSLRQVFKQDMSVVTSGLQEEDNKLSEIDTKKDATANSCIRLTKMKQTQLIRSTTQFKNQLPLLHQDKHPDRIEVPEKQDTLRKYNNQQVEEQYGSQPKLFSTPLTSNPTGLSKSNESNCMNKEI